VPHFFGLGPEQREDILEQFFVLMRSMNISYEALRGMPITYRRWFINRLVRAASVDKPKDQYGLDDDTPISAVYRNR